MLRGAGTSLTRQRFPCAEVAGLGAAPLGAGKSGQLQFKIGVGHSRGRRSCIARLRRCQAGGGARGVGTRAGRNGAGASRGSGGYARSPGLQQSVTRLRTGPRPRRSSACVHRDGSMSALRVPGHRKATGREVVLRVSTHSHGGGRSGLAHARMTRSFATRESHRACRVRARHVAAGARRPAWRRARALRLRLRDGLGPRRGQPARPCRGITRRCRGERERDEQHPGQQSHERRTPREDTGRSYWANFLGESLEQQSWPRISSESLEREPWATLPAPTTARPDRLVQKNSRAVPMPMF